MRLVNTISDRLLGLVAPKIEASAVVFCACCDWKVCMFAHSVSECFGPRAWCAGCSGDRCA